MHLSFAFSTKLCHITPPSWKNVEWQMPLESVRSNVFGGTNNNMLLPKV